MAEMHILNAEWEQNRLYSLELPMGDSSKHKNLSQEPGKTISFHSAPAREP